MGNSGLKQHYETAAKTGVLQISSHRLKEVPVEVLNLSDHLRILDVSKNKISSLPDDINKLQLLKQLNLSSNLIASLPEAITELKKLELLNLAFNYISKLPPSFGNLINLKQVYLNKNKLKHFPMELLGLTSLEVLALAENKITVVPSGMADMHAVELNLSENEISNLGDLHQAPRLKILRLEENCLSLDAITPDLLRESKIHTLNLDGNLFELKKLASLEGYNEYTERYTAMKKKMF